MAGLRYFAVSALRNGVGVFEVTKECEHFSSANSGRLGDQALLPYLQQG
jgi:hypothetical protein